MNENKDIKKEEVKEDSSVSNESAPLVEESQIIGEIPVEKQKGTLWLFVFFGILIAVVFGLPYIDEYLESKNTTLEDETIVQEEEQEEDNQQEAQEVIYREIDSNTIFNVDNLRFENLSKEYSDDYYLVFTLTNNGNDYAYEDPIYYIELYTSEKTLLERVKLIDDDTLIADESKEVKLLINDTSYNDATLITVVQKSVDDYPEVELTRSVDDYKLLICTTSNDTITYYFNNDELQKITDVVSYDMSLISQSTYNNALSNYTNVVTTLNTQDGISASLAQSDTAFSATIDIDLTQASSSALTSRYYYELGTLPKVVSFEMESMRYSCD